MTEAYTPAFKCTREELVEEYRRTNSRHKHRFDERLCHIQLDFAERMSELIQDVSKKAVGNLTLLEEQEALDAINIMALFADFFGDCTLHVMTSIFSNYKKATPEQHMFILASLLQSMFRATNAASEGETGTGITFDETVKIWRQVHVKDLISGLLSGSIKI